MNQEQIGKFIASIRKEKNMTQMELANKIGVSDRTISKWENGRGMPDWSLIKPLCRELEITINELFCGERLKEEQMKEKSESNLLNTIIYTNKKVDKIYNKLGIILLTFGVLITITALTIFPSESSFSSIYSVIGLIISLIGFAKFTRKLNYPKRVALNFGFYIIFMIFLFTLDYINVKLNNQVPMFSTKTTTIDTTIYYDTPFYDVFRCNTNKENEYFVIESNKKHNAKSIMEYCKNIK